MDLSISFNAKKYESKKLNDFVLSVRRDYVELHYDFAMGVMYANLENNSKSGFTATPFSQLDPDAIDTFRNRLVNLQGRPPESAETLDLSKDTEGYELSVKNDYVIGIKIKRSLDIFVSLDYAARILIVRSYSSEATAAIVPFSQLDPVMLGKFRDKLIALNNAAAIPPDVPSAKNDVPKVDKGEPRLKF